MGTISGWRQGDSRGREGPADADRGAQDRSRRGRRRRLQAGCSALAEDEADLAGTQGGRERSRR